MMKSEDKKPKVEEGINTIPNSNEGDPAKQEPKAEAFDEPQLSKDASTEVAQNEYLVRLSTGLSDRQEFQEINIRRGLFNTSYKPEFDAPYPSEPIPILPGPEELRGARAGSDMIQCLVVGLVIAADPYKFSLRDASGTAGGSSASREREREGSNRALESAQSLADMNVLRAVVPVTGLIRRASVKYYVACKPVGGVCGMRVIRCEGIFFFPEFWRGVDARQELKKRRVALGRLCRYHAAVEKTEEDSPAPPQQPSSSLQQVPRRRTPQQRQRYTPATASASLSDRGAPSPEAQPQTPPPDIVASFLGFDRPMPPGAVRTIVAELQGLYPDLHRLDAVAAERAHAALCEGGIGRRLMGSFMALLLDRVRRCGEDGAADRGALEDAVGQIMHDLEIVRRIGQPQAAVRRASGN